MEKVTDWLLLWEQLSAVKKRCWREGKPKNEKQDPWKDRARSFDGMAKKRWSRPNASRDCLLATLTRHPDSTVLDIGAGTGSWALLMARHAARVTAMDPSEAMCAVMEEKLAAGNVTNVTIVQGSWPDVDVDAHDFSFASHSMYGVADFRAFVEKMIRVTRQTCFLLMRVLYTDTIMARAATKIWGQPYDSPTFQVAYNALMQMGIYPDVIMEAEGGWDPWSHDSIDEALGEVKRRLTLLDDPSHDRFLRSLLEKSLARENGRYVWPAGNRSGLIRWNVSR
ncbi:class I SAM-dependent methyltransferase [Desulfosarcina ovata]|uniref:SAM-dependent methyltransferase n=2 Tax=Desulfosarcina ovata TaxID=83564 RepID=A0A5K8AEG5_9BACT|nr:class I SAM-dependent methyltransferase [Desulfosarcina ovata]BBO83856.1 SAM-dependent methyltransferase [Desulfosarcina ovata subsp. sediminis]BBO90350.1 SAM-dependent methyltransferase [Desulfosarcina ovata subsp. ovata]